MKISDKGLALLKRFEGLRLTAYNDTGGKPTIGYGHLILSTDKFGKTIDEKTANELLAVDCKWAEETVNRLVRVKLNQNQFDALCSLVFNIGEPRFKISKALLYLNHKNYEIAEAECFDKERGFVNVNGKISQSIIKRRQIERKLWVS